MALPSLSDLKKELIHLSAKELAEVCLNLAKFKKENKQYLNFMLFNAHNLDGYITEVNEAIKTEFDNAGFVYIYSSKKTLRKILKAVNQYIKFSKDKRVEIEVRVHFCQQIIRFKLLNEDSVIDTLYDGQLKRIEKAIDGLHEDLQYDYTKIFESLLRTFVSRNPHTGETKTHIIYPT
jgi:hypothetical protein